MIPAVSIRSCREAILTVLLSQMVSATSERMSREARLTVATRAASWARLGEIRVPGDFMV
jgi:hypothetical protein